MPRFFTTDIAGSTARITGEDARHIAKSLRMRPGEELTLCDMNGFDYHCSISEISPELITLVVLEKKSCESEPKIRVSLFQALPKSDKLELIAQKAVELGVFEITPVLTSRCVSRWDKKDEEKKLERLGKIILEAAKQSGRGIIPRVNVLCGFEEAVDRMKASQLAILFYERAEIPLREIIAVDFDSVSIMTGSEGGFSPEEAAYAAQNGIKTASLGSRILRCETAPLCAISAIMFSSGEF